MNINNRVVLAALIIAIVLVGGYFLFFSNKSSKISDTSVEPRTFLGEGVAVTRYTVSGNSNDVASVSVPFQKSADATYYVSAAVDLNGDGSFSRDEWVVKNRPTSPRADWMNTYYFATDGELTDDYRVFVLFDDTKITDDGFAQVSPPALETKSKTVTVATVDAGTLLELATVTEAARLDSMKGVGIQPVYAQDLEISNDGIPDISQQPGECGPTAATNNIIDLLNRNQSGAGNALNPTEVIDELKTDMNWTRENGSLPDDFVAGKAAWAERHGYPIETKKVGDRNGITTLEEIRNALENGDSVELRLTFGDANRRGVGGHMVTVTGIHVDGDETYLDINDPASPEGTDQYEVSSNQITNYAHWNGYTVLSWGFVQTWTGPVATTGTTPNGNTNASAANSNTNTAAANTNAAAANTNTGTDSNVSVSPTTLNFVYNHAQPVCPLPIGSIDIIGPAGSNWAVNFGPSGQPVWIDISAIQGPVSTPLNLTFPCQLEEYVNQTQQANAQINVYSSDNTLLGSGRVEVNGEFTNF